MNKKITIITSIALFFGLITQLVPIFTFTPYHWLIKVFHIIRALSPNINLYYLFPRLLTYSNFDTGLQLNFLDLSIYALILFGLILYVKSKAKEIRLLRMTFAIILVSKSLSVLTSIINLLIVRNLLSNGFELTYSLIALVSSIIWLYLSYLAIIILSEKSSLKRTNNDFIDSPKSQRFLHHIVDIILSISIFSSIIVFFLSTLLENAANLLGERFVLYVVFIISHLFYLVFFEVLLGATPAKYLTGSRVVMENGDKINLKTGILRSLARHVPFEAFSYLGEGNGWHDNWLKTRVVKEKNHGVPAKKYLWVIAAFIAIGLLSYIGYEMKNRYDRYVWERDEYNAKIQTITNFIDNPSEDCFIQITPENDFWDIGSNRYYLKTISFNDNIFEFKFFKMENSYPTTYEIEQYYESCKNKLPSIEVPLDQLKNSYTQKYRDYRKREVLSSVFIPGTNEKHYISKIYSAYKPNITLESSGYSYGSLYFHIKNEGWPASLIAIENIEGDLQWSNTLPEEIPTQNGFSSSLTIRAENYEYGKPYKFTFTISDSINHKQKFLVEGLNTDKKVTQILN